MQYLPWHTKSTQQTAFQILRIKLKWVPRLLVRTTIVFNKTVRLQQAALLAGGTPGCTGVPMPPKRSDVLENSTHMQNVHTLLSWDLEARFLYEVTMFPGSWLIWFTWEIRNEALKRALHPPQGKEGWLRWGSSQSFGFSDNRIESKTWELIPLFLDVLYKKQEIILIWEVIPPRPPRAWNRIVLWA